MKEKALKLESKRLYLKALSLNELILIKNNMTKYVDVSIEIECISDTVINAITKKIEKMKNVNDNNHEWYTYWLIINKKNSNGIGFIGFKGLPDEKGYSEVGYGISSSYRQKGLMTEALTIFINWASTFPECKGITATNVLHTNIRSNRVLKNCHFKLVSSLDNKNNYILTFS